MRTPWSDARVGDLIAARGVYGQPPRRGQILELIGDGPHRRFLVRWDEQDESILYPADGVVITPSRRSRAARRSSRRGSDSGGRSGRDLPAPAGPGA